MEQAGNTTHCGLIQPCVWIRNWFRKRKGSKSMHQNGNAFYVLLSTTSDT